MELFYGKDRELAKLAQAYFGVNFEPCTAIGLIHDNVLIGAVIYNNLHKSTADIPLTIEASVIFLEKRNLTRYVLKRLFSYPFVDLCVKTLFVKVAFKNKPLKKKVERLGFKYVARLRNSYPTGGDSALYDMTLNECRWI